MAAFADEIRSSKADVLWVALGAPKQNYEAERFRDHAAAPVIVTVGAAFDFIGGTKRRAPSWMQKLGLEWVFRMFQEPRRLGPRYLKNNPRFLADTVRQMRHKPSR